MKLLRLRTIPKITQKHLAERTGLSQSYITELENGKKANATKNVLEKIAQGLGVPLSELLDESHKLRAVRVRLFI